MGPRNWWQNCHRVQKTPRHSTQAKVQGGPAHVKGSTYSLPCERTWRFTAAPPLHEVGMLANMLRIALLAVAFIGSCLPPNASAADILACQAKDAVNLQDDGTLKNDSLAQRAAQGSLVIDLSSGKLDQMGKRVAQNDCAPTRQRDCSCAYLRTRVRPQRNSYSSNGWRDCFLAIPSQPFYLRYVRVDSINAASAG